MERGPTTRSMMALVACQLLIASVVVGALVGDPSDEPPESIRIEAVGTDGEDGQRLDDGVERRRLDQQPTRSTRPYPAELASVARTDPILSTTTSTTSWSLPPSLGSVEPRLETTTSTTKATVASAPEPAADTDADTSPTAGSGQPTTTGVPGLDDDLPSSSGPKSSSAVHSGDTAAATGPGDTSSSVGSTSSTSSSSSTPTSSSSSNPTSGGDDAQSASTVATATTAVPSTPTSGATTTTTGPTATTATTRPVTSATSRQSSSTVTTATTTPVTTTTTTTTVVGETTATTRQTTTTTRQTTTTTRPTTTTTRPTTTTTRPTTTVGSPSNAGLEAIRNRDSRFGRYSSVRSDALNLSALTEPAPVRDNGTVGDGQFRAACQYSHFAYDDPIIYPNQPGASHLHMFFGNTDVHAGTTTDSLVNSGGGTCNGFELNRSGYWTPALLDGRGNAVVPEMIILYYKTKQPDRVQRMPQGLKMVVGNATAESFNADWSLFWSCGDSGGAYNVTNRIPDCGGDTFNATVVFPQCWDGRNLDSADHRSHMALVSPHADCPSSHPVRLPQISILLYFAGVPSVDGWHLSSDRTDGFNTGPGATLHADWWGGWNDSAMDLWIDGCMKAARNCSFGQTGTDRMLAKLNNFQNYPGPYLKPLP